VTSVYEQKKKNLDTALKAHFIQVGKHQQGKKKIIFFKINFLIISL